MDLPLVRNLDATGGEKSSRFLVSGQRVVHRPLSPPKDDRGARRTLGTKLASCFWRINQAR